MRHKQEIWTQCPSIYAFAGSPKFSKKMVDKLVDQ